MFGSRDGCWTWRSPFILRVDCRLHIGDVRGHAVHHYSAQPTMRTSIGFPDLHVLGCCFCSRTPGAQSPRRLSMSVLGHKRTLTRVYSMSALPPKADIAERDAMSALCQKRTLALHIGAVKGRQGSC